MRELDQADHCDTSGEALRGLIDRIALHPAAETGKLTLELESALAGQLALANAEPPAPVLRPPNLSEVYGTKVTNLTKALNGPATKSEATTIIRSLLESIRLAPNADGSLALELIGELAGFLTLGAGQNEQIRLAAACCSSVLVAGARNRRYRTKLRCRT
ncbi:hypothetical protein [Shimia sp. MIT910701]|uniref:hypothetical protein n=2 Tax=unclassified Shimia TaxID=2630038 RepID=UPI00399A291C